MGCFEVLREEWVCCQAWRTCRRVLEQVASAVTESTTSEKCGNATNAPVSADELSCDALGPPGKVLRKRRRQRPTTKAHALDERSVSCADRPMVLRRYEQRSHSMSRPTTRALVVAVDFGGALVDRGASPGPARTRRRSPWCWRSRPVREACAARPTCIGPASTFACGSYGRPSAARLQQVSQVLTARKLEIVALIGSGCTAKDIARRLFASEGTRKVHLHNVFSKLHVRTRSPLAQYSREHGLAAAP